MKIFLKNKQIEIPVVKPSIKFLGLMFKSRETDNLLFDFSHSKIPAIHSFFVFFPFLAVWLNNKNKVTEFHFVRPFCPYLAPQKPANKLLEVPFNGKNRKFIEFFVGNGKI